MKFRVLQRRGVLLGCMMLAWSAHGVPSPQEEADVLEQLCNIECADAAPCFNALEGCDGQTGEMKTDGEFNYCHLHTACEHCFPESPCSAPCSGDVFVCPDGSTMHRDPKQNCMYPDCPGGDHAFDQATECRKLQLQAYKESAQGPMCEHDGMFTPTQCDMDTGECWCVNITTGEERNNTRMASDDGDPSCDGECDMEMAEECQPFVDCFSEDHACDSATGVMATGLEFKDCETEAAKHCSICFPDSPCSQPTPGMQHIAEDDSSGADGDAEEADTIVSGMNRVVREL